MNNKKLDLEITQEEIDNQELECSASEELMGQISVQEELKRIDIQENPISKASDELKNSDVYKEFISQAHAVGECFQILIGYGLDYNNAVAITSNMVQNKSGVEITKQQYVVMDKQL